jgi:CRISPR-associated protein Cmr2
MAVDTSPDFVVAIAYCLAYDHLGRAPNRDTLHRLRGGVEPYSDEERWLAQTLALAQNLVQLPPAAEKVEEHLLHLRHIQDQAIHIERAQIALLMGGATKIKQYVFESAKLPEIRGASALLDRINQVDIPALFNVRTDPDDNLQVQKVREQFARRHGMAPPDAPECVIYANGGEFLAFAPLTLAQALADEVEFLYTSATLVANSVAVWQAFTPGELVGGVGASMFWQRWEQVAYQERVAAVLGPHVVKELPRKKRFGELAAVLAGEKFRRREGNAVIDSAGTVRRPPKSTPQWETFAYGRRCRSCERRLASHEFPIADEAQWVCEACHGKLRMGWEEKRGWVKKFEHFLQDQKHTEAYYRVVHEQVEQDVRFLCRPRTGDGARLPDRPLDLHEIGEASQPNGYVGVIYADGNNMGALLETLHSPEAYHHFAETVFRETQDAVFAALATSLHPTHVERTEQQRKQEDWVHPFEILSIGGDDLFLIVPAHQALPIALQIAQTLEGQLKQDKQFQVDTAYDPEQVHRCPVDTPSGIGKAPQSTVGLSVGVLLADAKTPIFFLQNLVEQLLKSAKRRAKELKKQQYYFGGTIDFMALKSVTMITSKLTEFRDSALRVGASECRDRLTARPYTLTEMQQLLETVRTLKTTVFPRSQLYALRSDLWEGRWASTVNYLYFTERLGERERTQLRTVLDQRWCKGGAAPWRPLESERAAETVLADLIELYDFVEG